MLGDLINRGPGSLNVLRLMMERDYPSVMGNHELYLLAVYAGVMHRKKDTLTVFAAGPRKLDGVGRRLPRLYVAKRGYWCTLVLCRWSLKRPL